MKPQRIIVKSTVWPRIRKKQTGKAMMKGYSGKAFRKEVNLLIVVQKETDLKTEIVKSL